jgi:hypothetical protein
VTSTVNYQALAALSSGAVAVETSLLAVLTPIFSWQRGDAVAWL